MCYGLLWAAMQALSSSRNSWKKKAQPNGRLALARCSSDESGGLNLWHIHGNAEKRNCIILW
jgi:hypothetical protein